MGLGYYAYPNLDSNPSPHQADDEDARVEGASLVLQDNPSVGALAYGGRAYCCGDAAEKDKQERTAANPIPIPIPNP